MIHHSSHHSPDAGFSTLEALLVISIMAILSVLGIGAYRSYVKNVELDSTAKTITSDLKEARSKAMTGQDNLKWGIRFSNSSDDYYELFSTPTGYSSPSTTTSTVTYLSGTITFTAPSEGTTTDVIFTKITGTTTAATITLTAEGQSKTITVTGSGLVY